MQIKLSTQQIILIIGDVLVLLSFVWIGRDSHNLSTVDIAAGLFTALPFIIGWFLITPWFGIYKEAISQSWRKLVPRLLPAWVVAAPVTLILRALFLGRPVPAGIIPTFALVSFIYIGLVALVWRLVYMGWLNHSLKHRQRAKG